MRTLRLRGRPLLTCFLQEKCALKERQLLYIPQSTKRSKVLPVLRLYHMHNFAWGHLRRAKKSLVTGRITVLLEFPTTPGNVAILAAATTQQPTGSIVLPATFFNAEVAFGNTVAISKTGFVATNGGFVRVRLTFDLTGNTLPPLQFSWQFASNLPSPQPGYFFLDADVITTVVDKGGLPTIKGALDTLNF